MASTLENMTSWFKSQINGKPLGTSLSTNEDVKEEISKMQTSISKASNNYQNNIKKYKEVAKFNQHLTRSYMANLKVIVDVSELLNSYASVFTSLKTEFGKMDSALGKGLDLADFEYLQNLTKSKIDDLNLQFTKQSEGLKKLYTMYGKPEELNRVIVAQAELQKMIDSAGETYQNLATNTQTNNSASATATAATAATVAPVAPTSSTNPLQGTFPFAGGKVKMQKKNQKKTKPASKKKPASAKTNKSKKNT